MGLFGHKNKATPNAPARARSSAEDAKEPADSGASEDHMAAAKPDGEADEGSDTEGADLDNTDAKKQYVKEKAPVKTDTPEPAGAENDSEDETLQNTKLNAMLYHTSEDSIDMYRNESNSLDLLGRLYYDDYDPDNRQVVERVTSFTSLQALSRGSASTGINKAQPDHGCLNPPASTAKRPLFERQVSFDTLSDTRHLAITLKVKHPEFKFRRNNKAFLIGFSDDSELMKAVEWAFLEMVISGDTIIVLQVLDEKAHSFVDPSLAETVLEKLKKLNTHSKRISLVYEVVIGNPQSLLKKAILEYKPAMMIVGTHQYGLAPPTDAGAAHSLSPLLSYPQSMRHNAPHPSHLPQQSHHTPFHRALFSKASTSKHFLQYALVPVIIVKPFYKIQEKLDRPVDSENYFSDWLANIDVAHTREKKKKHRFGMRSPLLSKNSSRNLSHTSLTDFMRHDTSHERIHEKLTEQLQERTQELRGRSLGEMFVVGGPGSRDSSRSRSQSRAAPAHELPGGFSLSAMLSAGSRSESRSRSRSRLSRLFSG